MSETRSQTRRLPRRLLTLVALLALACAAAAQAGLSAQVGELRARLSRLDGGPWNGAAEQAFAGDLDALVTRIRGAGNPGSAAAELRQLTVAAHRRHADWLAKVERDFMAGEGEDPFELEEVAERRQLALQILYLRNWIDLESATRWQPTSGDREEWLRRAVDGFGSIAAIEDQAIAAESLYGRGLAQRALGRIDAAAKDLARVIELAPEQFAARAGTALVEMQIDGNRIADALVSSRSLVNDHPSPEAEFLRAKTLLLALAGNRGDAETRAAQRREVAELVGRLERRGGSWPGLARQLVAAGITQPEEWLDDRAGPTIRWTVAESLRTQGRCNEAVPLYRALVEEQKSPRAELLLAFGECRFRAGDYDGALQSLQRVAANSAVAADAAYLRFKAAEALHHGAATEEHGDRLRDLARAYVDAHPRHHRAYEARFRLGEVLRERGDRIAAAAEFDAVSGDATFRVQASFQAAQCYVEEWEIHERRESGAAVDDLARAALKRLDRFRTQAAALRDKSGARPADAAMLAPMETRAEVISALIRTRLGGEENFAAAIALLDGFEERHPGEAELRAQAAAVRATALLGTGRYAEAREALAAFLDGQQGSERDYDLMRGLGVRTLTLAGERDEAGDAKAASDLRASALQIYETLLAAAESGRLAAESPDGLRSLVTRLHEGGSR